MIECPICGAAVTNQDRHNAWHETIDNKIQSALNKPSFDWRYLSDR